MITAGERPYGYRWVEEPRHPARWFGL